MPEEEPKQEAPKENEEPAGGEAPAESAEMPSSLDNLASPEARLTILVSSIATQALVGLGLFEHPITKKKEVELDSAKYSIDLLQVQPERAREEVPGRRPLRPAHALRPGQQTPVAEEARGSQEGRVTAAPAP